MTIQNLKPKTNIINNNDIEKRIFKNMLCFAGFLSICYLFLLGDMVWNIVARKNLESHVVALNTEVGSLELEYLALSSKVDLNLAHSLGFNEASVKKFATRKPALGVVALANNEL